MSPGSDSRLDSGAFVSWGLQLSHSVISEGCAVAKRLFSSGDITSLGPV